MRVTGHNTNLERRQWRLFGSWTSDHSHTAAWNNSCHNGLMAGCWRWWCSSSHAGSPLGSLAGRLSSHSLQWGWNRTPAFGSSCLASKWLYMNHPGGDPSPRASWKCRGWSHRIHWVPLLSEAWRQPSLGMSYLRWNNSKHKYQPTNGKCHKLQQKTLKIICCH